MKKRAIVVSTVVLWGCFAPAVAHAQQVLPYMDVHFIRITRLMNQWAVGSTGDSRSCVLPTDCPSTSDLVETWYVAKEPMQGTEPFFRLVDASQNDHMDSVYVLEGSYLLDSGTQPLGYPWLSHQDGMSPITRYINPGMNDHVTYLSGAAASGYLVDKVYNGNQDPGRWGYERFGIGLTKKNVTDHAEAIGQRLENDILKILFNPIWGNAIGEVVYRPTTTPLVHHKIGDMLNAGLLYQGPGMPSQINPTLSGGGDMDSFNDETRWAGSPVLSTSVHLDEVPQSFTTVTRPLHFGHQAHGGDGVSPWLWRGTFTVTTTLGCKITNELAGPPGWVPGPGTTDSPLGSQPASGDDWAYVMRPDVIKIRLEVQPDLGVPAYQPWAGLRVPGWFRTQVFGAGCSEVGKPSNVIVRGVDLTTGEFTSYENEPVCTEGDPSGPTLDYGGLVAMDADETFAIGVAVLDNDVNFNVWSRCGPTNCASVLGQQTIIYAHKVTTQLSPSSPQAIDTYWAFGLPQNVRKRLHEIWEDGGDCRN